MTCASCVNRVERFLRKTDGVLEANVNLATEQAHGALRSVARRPRRARRARSRTPATSVREAKRRDRTRRSTAAADADAERRARETRRLGLEAAVARWSPAWR